MECSSGSSSEAGVRDALESPAKEEKQLINSQLKETLEEGNQETVEPKESDKLVEDSMLQLLFYSAWIWAILFFIGSELTLDCDVNTPTDLIKGLVPTAFLKPDPVTNPPPIYFACLQRGGLSGNVRLVPPETNRP